MWQSCSCPWYPIWGAAAQMATKAHSLGHREQVPFVPWQSCDISGIRAEVEKDSSRGLCAVWRYIIFRRDWQERQGGQDALGDERATQLYRAPPWDRQQVRWELLCVGQRRGQKGWHCGRCSVWFDPPSS